MLVSHNESGCGWLLHSQQEQWTAPRAGVGTSGHEKPFGLGELIECWNRDNRLISKLIILYGP